MKKVVKKSVNSVFKSALKYGSRQLYLHQELWDYKSKKATGSFQINSINGKQSVDHYYRIGL
jgi:hypothetical protein